MELRRLRYFVATAETGTVSAAAAVLHVTQPGLSRQLRQLEQELGVGLFDRAGRRLTLSPAGRALLPLARELLDQAEAFREAASLQARGRLEQLTIAAPGVTLTDVVAPFIVTLEPDDPVAAVLEADAREPVEALHRGADLAIGTLHAPEPYESVALVVVPVWAYVPATHPWASRRSVLLEEVLAEPVIVLPPSVTSRQALEAARAEAGLTLARSIEAADGTVAQALAAGGRGIAVVSDDPRFDLVALGIDVGDRRLSVRLIAVWDPRRPAARTIEAFAHRLAQFSRHRYVATAL